MLPAWVNMSDFLRRAGLPVNCSALILGRKYLEILDGPIKNLGIEAVYLPDNPYVDERLSGHADLSAFHGGGNNLFLAPFLQNTDFSIIIKEKGFNIYFPEIKQNKFYPYDAALNACAFGDKLIYGKNITSCDIVNCFQRRGETTLISTKQGYAGCSVCVVDENSIITSDSGIYKEAVKAGLEVLLVSAGYVSLTGFEYGFLGGASFKISAEKLCFTGTLDSHPDKIGIEKFLHERHVEPVYLTSLPVFDIGSAIPIMEK